MQKEYGSDFHYIDFPSDKINPAIQDIYPHSRLFFSGRSALLNLITSGIKLYKWDKIYFPDYYCHDTDDFIKPLPITICYYDDGPYKTGQLDISALDKKTNVFIHVNYFGFDTHSRLNFKNAFIIEDHTHDLVSDWALNSTAHYCFASLRKSLPIPAGGIIWSPQKLELPAVPAESQLSDISVYMRLSAMLLKRVYLENENVEKDDFRNLYIYSESLYEKHEANGYLPVITHKIINKIPIQTLRESKIKNYNYLNELIKAQNVFWQIKPIEKQCPFGFVLYFADEEKRNAMKAYLILNRIYPAVLWPDQTEPKARDFSGRSLLIHCDIRHNSEDMEFLAETFNSYRNGE